MAHFTDETDTIPCTFSPLLLYGGPSLRKTTLGQTAHKPLTLDFDFGIHRCAYRKQALRFDSWIDHMQSGGQDGSYKDKKGALIDYGSIIVDTGGRALDLMIPGIMRESAKNGNPMGGLSPQGWGILGARFTIWLKQVKGWGKDFIMLCHEEEDKNAAGNPYFKPDLPGKMSWKEVHKNFDMIGRIYKENNRHYLNFSPTEFSVGKNAAGFDIIELPDQHDPNFLASLLLQAKDRIGKTTEASANVASTVKKAVDFLETKPTLPDFNDWLAKELPGMDPAAKAQAWHLCEAHAKAEYWTFNKEAKKFERKEGENGPDPTKGAKNGQGHTESPAPTEAGTEKKGKKGKVS